jgi:hypothetical protein
MAGVRIFGQGFLSVESLQSNDHGELEVKQGIHEDEKCRMIGNVFDSNEGNAGFDRHESSADFKLVFDQEDVRIDCDHGFIGMIFDRGECRSIDVAVDEECFVGVILCEFVELNPFGCRTVEVIVDCDSYDGHGSPFNKSSNSFET